MSLAVLTTAYANLVGIETQYIEETSSPVFFQSANLELISNHVKTKLVDPSFEKKDDVLYFFEPGVIIDYFPSRNSISKGNIDDKQFMAMYYQNLAADALENKEFNNSAWLAIEGLKLAPRRIEIINLLAVIFRHLEQDAQAESIYLYGLSLKPNDLNLLFNYQVLLTRNARYIEAELLQNRIDNAKDPSPFRWVTLGNEHYKNKDYRRALKYYSKAIELAPYIPQGYAGKAKTLYLLGDQHQAKEALTLALEKVRQPELERLYQAKLTVLSQH